MHIKRSFHLKPSHLLLLLSLVFLTNNSNAQNVVDDGCDVIDTQSECTNCFTNGITQAQPHTPTKTKPRMMNAYN